MDLEIRRGRAQFIPKQKEICLILKGIECPPACRGWSVGGQWRPLRGHVGEGGGRGKQGLWWLEGNHQMSKKKQIIITTTTKGIEEGTKEKTDMKNKD